MVNANKQQEFGRYSEFCIGVQGIEYDQTVIRFPRGKGLDAR